MTSEPSDLPGAGGSGEPPMPSLEEYLLHMVETGASDLFLRAQARPAYRINGRITRGELPAPSTGRMQEYVEQVLTPLARRRFGESPDVDVAFSAGGKRFRLNVFLQQGTPAIVARLIPPGALDFEQLHLPPAVRKMAEAPSGLVLVVGPTGCGKSTTLAAMIHHINATQEKHIVTIEDPIEFVHEEIRSLIHQRQVGYDTESYPTALRHVVRQSPDVILIGEMRDAESIQTALSAALTGHLVLSTLHTNNVVQSIDRMLNYFPPEARTQAQADLAVTLVGMVSMRLLPRVDGSGRVPALEVLLGTPTVRRLITEGSLVEIYDVMKRNRDIGMATLNQSLVDLVQLGAIDEATAMAAAPNAEEFRLNMQGMFTGIDSIDVRTEDQARQEEADE